MSSPAKTAKEVFLEAIEAQTPECWPVILDRACGTDAPLRRRVEVLLKAHVGDGSLLDHPVVSPVATLDQPSVERTGTQIGPYRLLEEIGQGGMGVVYMAEQKLPVQRVVALKLVKPGMNNRQVLARFEAERQALAMMDHPSIAHILEAGMTDMGRPYFVMELVRGIPINEFCDQKRLTLRERITLFVQVCQAVQHAHQKGIIHRDLKPTNVLVTMLDVQAVPKVIDFGIAKAFGPQLTDQTQVTGFAQLVGTPLYMSPEQAEMNQLGVDTRSDVYSLGVMLYELLTGTTPFDQELLKKTNFDELRRLLREQDPPRPSARISTLDAQVVSTISQRRSEDPRRMATSVRGELDWIVMKMLEKDRERRYESASALADDLERYLSGAAVQACPPTLKYRCRKFARRYKSVVATGLIVACAVLVGTTVSIVEAVRATQAEQVAELGLQSEREARLAEQAARKDAEQAQTLAQQNAADAYRQQYKAEIQLGLVDLDAGNVSRLYQTLVGHLPNSNRANRRGWEWYYLLSRCQEGRTLCQHYGEVSSVAWSPDGRNLATTSYDGDAIIWDAQSGERVRRFSFGGTLKRGAAWSPDSQRLAWGSVGDENAVRIWDRRTDEVRILRGHTHSLISCVWSADGSRLATTSMDGTARIWDVKTWQCLHVLRGHKAHVEAACWVDDNKSLVTTGRGGLHVWDAQTGELAQDMPYEEAFASVSMNPAAPRQLVLGTWGGQCWQIDRGSWQVTREIDAHAGKTSVVAFSPDGTTFASAGADGAAIIWNAADGRKLFDLRGHLGGVTSLAWNPNGKQLATSGSDGTVRLWEFPPPQPPVTFSATDPVKELNWSKEDQLLTSVSGNGTRTVWSLLTNTIVETTAGLPRNSVALSPNGQFKASVNGDQQGDTIQVTIEDVAVSKVEMEIDSERSNTNTGLAIPTLVWSPDSKRLVVHDRGHLDVWQIPGGQSVFSWDGPAVNAVSWAPDSRRLAVAGGGDRTDNGTQAFMAHVHVFDVEGKTRLLKKRLSSQRFLATTVSWDLSGDKLATGNSNGEVGVWDASTGNQLTVGKPHVAWVNALAWAPDGRRIASVSMDGKLKVWDPMTGDEYITLTDGKQRLRAVSWSSDGTRLAAGDKMRQVQVWDAAVVSDVSGDNAQRRLLARMHAMRGVQSREHESLPEALSDFSRAIELAPGSSAYRFSRAIVYARQGAMDQALADLTAGLDLDPDDTHVLRTRVDLYASLGRWKDALTDASRLVELRQDSFYRYQQAVIQLMLGDFEAYRESCQREWMGDPEELMYGSERRAWTCSIAPIALTDVERILPLIAESIKQSMEPVSENIGAHGAILYRIGRADEAVDQLIEANRAWEQAGSIVAPGSGYDLLPGYTWYFLAMACHDLGRYAESRTWYDKAETYTQNALAQPAVFLLNGSMNWHQRAVLKMLQREARKVLGVTQPEESKLSRNKYQHDAQASEFLTILRNTTRRPKSISHSLARRACMKSHIGRRKRIRTLRSDNN